MMESIEEEFVHSRYGQGYSADTDTIREHEYPLLNGMA
jgi:molybdenum cofactor sulfurtransferase